MTPRTLRFKAAHLGLCEGKGATPFVFIRCEVEPELGQAPYGETSSGFCFVSSILLVVTTKGFTGFRFLPTVTNLKRKAVHNPPDGSAVRFASNAIGLAFRDEECSMSNDQAFGFSENLRHSLDFRIGRSVAVKVGTPGSELKATDSILACIGEV